MAICNKLLYEKIVYKIKDGNSSITLVFLVAFYFLYIIKWTWRDTSFHYILPLSEPYSSELAHMPRLVHFYDKWHTFWSCFQVKLSNPSSKPLTYHVLIAGLDARDFKSVKGDSVTIPPKSTHSLAIEFKSRFLRPAEAVLVLVGRRAGSSVGSTLVFNLRTQIDNITPRVRVLII